jgi:hypothetical protein
MMDGATHHVRPNTAHVAITDSCESMRLLPYVAALGVIVRSGRMVGEAMQPVASIPVMTSVVTIN